MTYQNCPQSSQFAYDALDRKTLMTDPTGQSSTYAYDPGNLLTSTTDRDGRRSDYSYEALRRLRTETWTDSSGLVTDTRTYTYDAANDMLTAANSQGTYVMGYDALNRLTADQEPFGVTLTFSYDRADNRTLIQDNLGGTTNLTTSSYDAVNRVTSREFGGATPLREDMTYTPTGQVASATRYSDLAGMQKVGASAYTYDALDRVVTIQHQDGSGNVLASDAYTYDIASRLTVQTITGATTTYQYDDSNELTSEQTSSSTKTYGYDLEGNRTLTGYTTGTANRLTHDGMWTYTYDHEGNLVGKATAGNTTVWVYTYDNHNHMVSATETTATQTVRATYAYDALDNRLEKDVSTNGAAAVITRFAYMGQDVWADLNGANNNAPEARYLRGDAVDQLFARIQYGGANPGPAWYLADREGSIQALTDGAGVVQAKVTYDGYGNATETGNTAFGDRYKYTDREYDAETGLQYNRARYYDASVGRWTTEDPAGFKAGDTNLYRYVHNGPTNAVDPTGRFLLTPTDEKNREGHQQILNFLTAIMRNPQDAFNRPYVSSVGAAVGGPEIWYVNGKGIDDVRRVLSRIGNPHNDQERFVHDALYAMISPKFNRKITSDDNGKLTLEPVDVPEEWRDRIMSVKDAEFLRPSRNRGWGAGPLSGYKDYEANHRAFRDYTNKIGDAIVRGYAMGYVTVVTAVTPGVNVLVPAYEAIVGKDVFGNELSTTERAIAGATASLPFVGRLVGKVAGLLRATEEGAPVARDLEESLRLVKAAKTEEQLAAAARFNGASEAAAKVLSSQKGKAAARGVLTLQMVLGNSCFTAGTPLLTPDGSKLIEQFQPGDWILSRSEFDPDGPLTAKVVEAIFERVGRILHVHVGGQVIRTTTEHPFWVYNEAWLPASRLRVGDLLVSHDGQVMPIEDLLDTEEYETVYNLRVADYHTYFVGHREWGFSVWAHNAACAEGVRLALEAEGISIPKGDSRLDAIAQFLNDGNYGAARRAVKDLPGADKIPGKTITNILDAAANPPVLGKPTPTVPPQRVGIPNQTGPELIADGTRIRFNPDLIAQDLTFEQIQTHGDPAKWTYRGTKTEAATGQGFRQGDLKVYEVYTDTSGRQIEYHYHMLRDGQITESKLKFPGTTNLRE